MRFDSAWYTALTVVGYLVATRLPTWEERFVGLCGIFMLACWHQVWQLMNGEIRQLDRWAGKPEKPPRARIWRGRRK